MKIVKAITLCFLFAVCVKTASAQQVPLNEPDYNKPQLFSDLPSQIPVNISQLQSLFSLAVNSSVNITIAPNFTITGQVVSTSSSKNVNSTVIRLSNRPGAAFTFTRVMEREGNYKYLGRILSLKNSDAYELVYENLEYSLKKKILYDIISE